MARDHDAYGFSLVEVVIAMLVLGLIAIALLPPLFNGLMYASEQSTIATATRHLNGLVEDARSLYTCGATNSGGAARLPNPAAFAGGGSEASGTIFRAGNNEVLTVTANRIDPVSGVTSAYACTDNALITFRLTATDQSGDVVATVTASVFTGTP